MGQSQPSLAFGKNGVSSRELLLEMWHLEMIVIVKWHDYASDQYLHQFGAEPEDIARPSSQERQTKVGSRSQARQCVSKEPNVVSYLA